MNQRRPGRRASERRKRRRWFILRERRNFDRERRNGFDRRALAAGIPRYSPLIIRS